MKLVDMILDLIYPPRCMFCHKLVRADERPVCRSCEKSVKRTVDGGEQHGNFFEVCVSPLYYEDETRQALLRYKFHGLPGYGATLGALMADCVRENLEIEADIVSWVPLSRRRLRKRGYDQAEILARSVSGGPWQRAGTDA